MSQPVISFVKCLSVMALSLASKDVADLKADFLKWLDEATPLLKKHGLLRAFKGEVKIFLENKMEFTEEDGIEMAKVLKLALPSFIKDVSIAQEMIAMVRDCNTFFKKDSAPAWSRLSKNVTFLNDTRLAQRFLDDEEEDNGTLGDFKTHDDMVKIVAKLTGRKNDPVLTLNEMRDNREKFPKTVEKYSALRKVFVANYKRALLKFVRTSGKTTVDVKVARKYLGSLGCDYIPKGFVGQIDEQGRLYTSAGKLISGMLIGEVVMNPSYDPKTDNTYVCYLKANKGQALRTANFLKSKKAERFEKVNDFIGNVDDHRKGWVADLKSLDKKNEILAAMVETIYQTQARIGGEGNEMDGQPTFGIATLRRKHVKVLADGIEFDYPGKKGTQQHHTLRGNSPASRRVVAIVKELAKNKKPEDYLFTFRAKPIPPQAVNKYLRSKGINVSIHKFRHLAGTKLAMELLKSAPYNKKNVPSQAQAEKWIKEEFKKVGEMLHHRTGSGEKQKTTAMTAINSYVDPSVLKNWFAGLGLRVPKWVPKTGD